MIDGQERIQQNLKMIREYLLKSFPGFNMTEDTPDPSVSSVHDDECKYLPAIQAEGWLASPLGKLQHS